jgi:hypothetical protein
VAILNIFAQEDTTMRALQIVSASLALSGLAAAQCAFSGCCNTYLVGRLLVVGLQSVTQPLPQLGCTLLTSPDLVLFQATGSMFALQMPSAPFPATTMFAQGATIYFTTIGFSTDWAFSRGSQINLQ